MSMTAVRPSPSTHRPFEVRVGPGSGLHDLVRPVHDGAVSVDRARADHRPRPGRGIEDTRRRVRPGVEDLAVREDEHERVERGCQPGAGEVGPQIRRGVEDRRERVDRCVAERRQLPGPVENDVVSREGEDTAIGQFGGRRIPATDAHVGRPRPLTGRRIVDRRVGETEVRGDVPADDQRPPVRKCHVPGAEEVAPVRNGRERAGGRIPDALGVRGPRRSRRTCRMFPVGSKIMWTATMGQLIGAAQRPTWSAGGRATPEPPPHTDAGPSL